MKLSQQQMLFTNHLVMLLQYIISSGYRVTLGEAFRTKEQQQIHFNNGVSLTMNSQHLNRMAIDLNIFDKAGQLVVDKTTLSTFASYWKSLDPNNAWGGDFKKLVDTPHFERKLLPLK